MNHKNIIKTIYHLMKNRSENIQTDNELLIHYYSNAALDEQKIINTIMVCICGYSLETIINHPENIKGIDSQSL